MPAFYLIGGLLALALGIVGLDKLKAAAEEASAGGVVALLPVLLPWVGVVVLLVSWKGKGSTAEQIAALGVVVSLFALLYVLEGQPEASE